MEGKKKTTPTLTKRPNRVGVLFFFPSIHLKTEEEPASET
jgi:hypothetical protein